MIWHRLLYGVAFGLRREDVQLSDEMKQCTRDALHECANMNQWTIHELEIDNDYVGMIVQVDPQVSADAMIQQLKDASNEILKEKFPQLRDQFQGVCIWADEYNVETVGDYDPEAVEEYIDSVND